jgi:hypothetical protein
MNAETWKCPTCEEEVAAQYDQCLNCGTPNPFVSDESADDSGRTSRSVRPPPAFDHTQCPHCEGHRITMGDIGGGETWAQYPFRPDGLSFWVLGFSESILFSDRFRSCLDCGLSWSTVSPEDLTSRIAKEGKQATKEQFGL